MGKFVVGLILGFIIIPVGVYFYFVSGSAPVATAAQAMPFEKMLARKALHARVEKEMPRMFLFSRRGESLAGAEIYVSNCAVCHGLPGKPTTGIANGMYPVRPPSWRAAASPTILRDESYWKVANGIRLTGMPAFEKSLNTTQMWQVSLLIANADKLPAGVKQGLAASRMP